MKYILLLSCLYSSASMAGGHQFSSTCEKANEIRVSGNNQGFFISSDCKSVFVLPPALGKQSITGRSIGNLDRCQEVRSLNKILTEINKQIAIAIKGKIDDSLLNELYLKRKKVLSEYSDLANTIGASVELNFNMAIDKNLQAMRELNSGLGFNFLPVNLKDVQLHWNQKADQDPEMRIAFNKSLPMGNLNQVGSGSFSARLDLSLFGACPLRDPFTRELPERIRGSELAGLITPNVIYKYEVGATYTYVARYNRGALAAKIRELSTAGGFFKTSTSAKLIETVESSGWFSLEMKCDDSRVCDLAKLETAYQIKQRLMQEVLDGISLARFGYPIAPVESGTPGKNGASSAAEGLRKCPHAYCQAGAIILDIASSSFGGTSKTDSYITANNHMVEEKVSITTPVEFVGVMGFSY